MADRMNRSLIQLSRIDTPNASTTFTGESFDSAALTSEAKWSIKRVTVEGNEVVTQFVNDGKFDQIWDNRASLFPPIPFTNTFAIQFDGGNDRIDYPDNSAYTFDARSEACSFNIWVKSTSGSQNYMEKGSDLIGWRFWNATSGGRLTLDLRGTGGSTDRIRVRENATNAALSDGIWHMLTATYDGSGNASGVALYIDGVVVPGGLEIQNDALITDTSTADILSIASRSGGGTNFTGNMDEVNIWDSEMSAAQVTTLYNAGTPIDLQAAAGTISSSLVFWPRMGDGVSDVFPIIQDVESLLNGTMINMTIGDIETEVPRE